jgi:hypothetical protein
MAHFATSICPMLVNNKAQCNISPLQAGIKCLSVAKRHWVYEGGTKKGREKGEKEWGIDRKREAERVRERKKRKRDEKRRTEMKNLLQNATYHHEIFGRHICRKTCAMRHTITLCHPGPLRQCEPIIIMINQLNHIVSITDNRPKKLSYHLEIWYLDPENYLIISKRYRFSKCIISYQNWYSNVINYHIISKKIFKSSKLSYIKNDILIFNIIILYWKQYLNFKTEKYFNQNKTSKFFKILVLWRKEA